ncbi:16210_t:CDS:2, partial [Cetraspora pellucida]
VLTTSVIAISSGIAFLPPYGGAWWNCTTNFSPNQSKNSSCVMSSIMVNSKSDINYKNCINLNYYCDTIEYETNQCDSLLMGLPSPNQTNLMWCLRIGNPFNNSQKVYVSFTPDKTSVNATNIDTNVITNGVDK